MMRCSPLRAHAPQLLALSSRRAALSSSATQPDVVVLGASVMDLMAYVPTMPSPGATVLGTGFEMDFGGKGANQAVMAGKLGCNVAMITKINGGDAFGREMVGNFEDNGVSAAHVLNTDKAATGAAAIVIDDSGQNQIAVVMGANNELTEADMEASRAAIAGAQMLVCQLEVPLPVTMAAMRIARDEGTTVFLNTAPARELPAEAFELADIICPNETEATILTGLPVETVDEAKAAGAKLLQMGVKNVILTLGERGALLVNGETDGQLHGLLHYEDGEVESSVIA